MVKLCSLDDKKSQFYKRKKDPVVYYAHCKECQKNDTHRRSSQKKESDIITGNSQCISTESLIVSTARDICKNFQDLEPGMLINYTNQLSELAKQYELEKRISASQSMYFPKHDVGYSSSNPVHVNSIKSVIINESLNDGKIITAENIHIFDRKDKVKIIVVDDVEYDNERRLAIKNAIKDRLVVSP
jgi:hypothetical protein